MNPPILVNNTPIIPSVVNSSSTRSTVGSIVTIGVNPRSGDISDTSDNLYAFVIRIPIVPSKMVFAVTAIQN